MVSKAGGTSSLIELGRGGRLCRCWPATSPGREPVSAQPSVNRRAAEVQLRGGHLVVSGQRFFLLGIRHTGTPLKTLRDAGFNTVWLDESTPPGLVEDAVNLGFWIVPSVTPPGMPGRPGGPLAPQSQRSRFSLL